MGSAPNNGLGDVYIKYLEPIELKSYLNNLLGSDTLNDYDSFEKAAFELTDDLMKLQQRNTPITLNSIISASLLQE